MEKNKVKKNVEIIVASLLFITISSGAGNIFAGSINSIDEGQHLAWVNHMMLGEKMYKDIYITYGPFHVYPLYALMKTFEPSMWLGRVYILTGGLIGFIAALQIMRQLDIRMPLRWVALILLATLPILQLRQGIGLVFLLVMLYTIEKYSDVKMLLLGALNMFAFLVSPDIGLICTVLSIGYILFSSIKDRSKIFLRKAIFFLSGILSVLIPFLLWAGLEGWLNAYVLTTRDVMTSFSGVNLPNGKNFPSPAIFFPNISVNYMKNLLSQSAVIYYGLAIYAFSIIYIIRKAILFPSQRLGKITVVWLFGILLYQVLISRSGIGHFFFVLSPLIVLTTYLMQEIHDRTKNVSMSEKIMMITLLAFLSLFLIRVVKINLPATQSNLNHIFTERRIATTRSVGSIAIPKDQDMYFNELDRYFKKQNKNSKIFILSNEPVLYFILKKDNPTRYDLPFIAMTKEKRYEIVSDLHASEPDFILYNTSDWPVDEVSNRRRLPEIVQFINQNYKKEALIESTIVYKRNELQN
jgi:MFS family permease